MTTPELPLPVVAYLYHDGESAEALSPLLHSIGLVVASDRRKEWRNETPLTTLANAESARAPLAAEVERLRAEVDRMQNRAVLDDDAAIERALTSLAWDNDNTRWPEAYSEEEQQMERENMRRALDAANKVDGPRAYCRACQADGMSDQAPYPVAAAVRTADGLIHSMPAPHRHHHIVHAMHDAREATKLIVALGEQGFLLSNGQFATRAEAARIAISRGVHLKAPPLLYSEDLW